MLLPGIKAFLNLTNLSSSLFFQIPEFYDNSGHDVTIVPDDLKPSRYPVKDDLYTVRYTAKDIQGNTNTNCSFSFKG